MLSQSILEFIQDPQNTIRNIRIEHGSILNKIHNATINAIFFSICIIWVNA